MLYSRKFLLWGFSIEEMCNLIKMFISLLNMYVALLIAFAFAYFCSCFECVSVLMLLARDPVDMKYFLCRLGKVSSVFT